MVRGVGDPGSDGPEPVPTAELLTLPPDKVLPRLKLSPNGLTAEEVEARLERYGPNRLAERERRAAVIRFLDGLRSPLVIILLVAGILSGLLGQPASAIIIFAVVLMSVSLTFFQESRAGAAAEALRERVETTATVRRDNAVAEIHLHEVVPGDIVYLSAGDIVPADSRLLVQKDLFVDQAALTGESFPVEKNADALPPEKTKSPSDWEDFLFMGTSVVSGTATAVVVRTGGLTEFGKIAKRVAQRKGETEFERGLGHFGLLIMEVTFVLVMFVFLILALRERDPLESLLFSVALAVGLTPELLPMIVTVNLAKGAVAMSKKGVIVKRLSSIQNFGNMDVLCTDKTGTLTENKVTLVDHVNPDGVNDEKVFLYAFLNSHYQMGLKSPLDAVILEHTGGGKGDALHDERFFEAWRRIEEIPFDFTRKRVSVVVEHAKKRYLITKGAPEEVLRVCSDNEVSEAQLRMTDPKRKQITDRFHGLSASGYRVLGVGYKIVPAKDVYKVSDEQDMVFLGFMVFEDPPKETARESLKMLKDAGIEMKILTGDNELVTKHVCEELGFEIKGIVLGEQITTMLDDALSHAVDQANIFARVTPAQKDAIIGALRRKGHVVGYLGDGINDAPSMRMADVSISVNNAVDVAKESADIILLDKKLRVLHDGVLEGRRTFGNTMKYVLMAISSNFGNMFSAAGAAIFLPFLPMLPTQVLLNNLMYDVSELAIPTDNVDEEYIQKPKRLDVTYIRNFMLFFGPISSVFDFLTFFVMLTLFDALHHPALFQTAWFVESLSTQTLIIFAIRTRKSPFFKSRPSRALLIASVTMVALGILLPFTPVGQLFQFEAPPPLFYPVLLAFIVGYLGLVEVLKIRFYKRYAVRLERYA